MLDFDRLSPVCLQHTGCLCDAVIALLKVPLSFQRYFFQKLQSTSIKVSHCSVYPLTHDKQMLCYDPRSVITPRS